MIICADDFGMAEDINNAILKLVDGGKLTAVSCAVAHPSCWAESISPLAAKRKRIDLGLHLVLTDEGTPASRWPLASLTCSRGFHPFRTLLWRSHRRFLDLEEVKRELQAQSALFEKWVGQPPDFIDGHLHVHQFPIVREALLRFVCELPPEQRPYIRNTHIPTSQLLRYGASLAKNLFIGRPGTVFRKEALRLGLRTNVGFAGVYNYSPDGGFGRLFGLFLQHLQSPNAILMVHPGLEEAWRYREYEVLQAWQPGEVPPNRWRFAC